MFRKMTLLILVVLWIPGTPLWVDAKETREDLDAETKLVEGFQETFIRLAEKVKPMVVNISPSERFSHSGNGKSEPDEESSSETPRGSGSGIIIDRRGFIVTNHHVVGDADEVEVGLLDKTRFTGKVVGKDPDTDIALVKIDAGRDLPAAVLGDSSQIKVGQWAIAVGDPFGLDRTVTVGIVSALGRENLDLSRYEDFIQTDASINPGNSGGPLFNIRGEVIGINTAIINAAKGIGFAIPSNMVQTVSAQLMARGKVTRGWLGVGIQLWTPDLVNQFGLKEGEGVLVSEVFEENPASKAGIEPGDIILSVNGQPVDTPNSLGRVVGALPPGKKINVVLLRNGNKKAISVELKEKKDEALRVAIPNQRPNALGLEIQGLTPEAVERFKLKEERGVLIAEVAPGSPAETGGLRRGDLLREIDHVAVDNMEDFRKAAEKIKNTESVLLRVIREDRAFFIVLDLK